MAYKDRKINRKARRRDKQAEPGFFEIDSAIVKERQKARDLRKTSWWKNKISAGKCHYCGGDFPPPELTMDHLIPLARGGKSEKINLVPACKDCNNKKKYMLPFEWDEYMNKLKNE